MKWWMENLKDISSRIPKEYDRLLTQYYGDYLTLPPIEKQTNPHELEVYLKEEE